MEGISTGVVLFGPIGTEVVLIIGIVIFLFGANRIPQLASSLGRSTKEYERGREEIEQKLQTSNNDVSDKQGLNSTTEKHTNYAGETLQDDEGTTTGEDNKQDRKTITSSGDSTTGTKARSEDETKNAEVGTGSGREQMKYTRPVKSQE